MSEEDAVPKPTDMFVAWLSRSQLETLARLVHEASWTGAQAEFVIELKKRLLNPFDPDTFVELRLKETSDEDEVEEDSS